MKEKDVFELIKFELSFDKEEYKTEGYKNILIPEGYFSFNKIEDEKVILNSKNLENTKFMQSEFLIITHNIKDFSSRKTLNFDNNLLYNIYKNNKFNIVNFEIIKDLNHIGKFEINLDWNKYFKLCNFDIATKINIKRNYKSDFSGTLRQNRTFYEEEFYLKYIGKFSNFIFNSKSANYFNIIG